MKNVGYGEAEIHIEAEEEKKYPSGYFLWDNGRVAMDAGHYTAKKRCKKYWIYNTFSVWQNGHGGKSISCDKGFLRGK
ncbi:MAG: hypothetical protein ACLTDT_07055 [Clostridium sp.]